jgi:hypothetical protein
MQRNVIGAHAVGFNTGSVGIAVLGTYSAKAPTREAEDALGKLLAWRLTSVTSILRPRRWSRPASGPCISGPSPGTRRRLTACPGNALYAAGTATRGGADHGATGSTTLASVGGWGGGCASRHGSRDRSTGR